MLLYTVTGGNKIRVHLDLSWIVSLLHTALTPTVACDPKLNFLMMHPGCWPRPFFHLYLFHLLLFPITLLKLDLFAQYGQWVEWNRARFYSPHWNFTVKDHYWAPWDRISELLLTIDNIWLPPSPKYYTVTARGTHLSKIWNLGKIGYSILH